MLLFPFSVRAPSGLRGGEGVVTFLPEKFT